VDVTHEEFVVVGHPGEEYMAFHRGFKDGCVNTAKRRDHIRGTPWVSSAYLEGYDQGLKAKGKALSEWCKEHNYKPSVLR
jgi:hypothetical protein